MRFAFDAEVWKWDARVEAGWFFVSLPAEAGADIREMPWPPRGFGSLRVEARVGATVWRTSIFPDSASATYVLPLKRAVREAESFSLGDVIPVEVEILG